MTPTHCRFLVCVSLISWVALTESQDCRFGSGCSFSCNCQDGAVCDSVTGDCPLACDSNDPGVWRGPACQIGNVAYGKMAHQSGSGTSHMANLCVDGNMNQDFDAGDFCSRPEGSMENPAFWQVDLGQEHVVYNVTVLSRTDCCADHMWPGRWYVRVGMDEQIKTHISCGFVDGTNDTFTQHVPGEAAFTLICESALTGRYVSIQKDASSEHPQDLYLCEVFVIGFRVGACSSGWGPGCLKSCHCEELCDPATGFCSSDCSPGWKKNILDVCEIECEAGRWGTGCVQECWCGDSSETCSRENGSCASGCATDYTGVSCNLRLPHLTSKPLITSSTSSSVLLEFQQWDPHMGGDFPPASYSIQYREYGRVRWTEGQHVMHSETSTSVQLIQDSLQPDTAYEFVVVPVTGEGRRARPSPIERYRTSTTTTTQTPTPTVTLNTGSSGEAVTGTDPTPPSAAGSRVEVITGVVVAVLVIIALLVILLVVFTRLRRQKQPAVSRLRKEDIVVVNAVNSSVQEEAHGSDDKEVLVPGGVNKEEFVEMEEGIENKRFIKPYGQDDEEKMEKQKSEKVNGSELLPLSEDKVYQRLGPVIIHTEDLISVIQMKKSDKDGFKNEYQSLPQGAITKWDTGNTSENKAKNRFVNIRAYDHSRVVLEKEAGDEHSDYINANYVVGYKDVCRHYIACQGPKKTTVTDMWRMIWQTEANRVVMVTNLVELAKTKSEEYWPNIGSNEYGKMRVSLISVEKFADFTIRTFAVMKEGVSRTIRQFHFTSWPDHGVPSYATALLEFRRRVRSFDCQATGPLIVHCSAGIGCTGTFLAIDYLLDQARVEQQFDVFSYVYIMRRARFNMIQTLDQYIFVYDALLEGLQSADRVIPCPQFHDIFETLRHPDDSGRTKLEEQFKILNLLKPIKKDENLAGLDAKNIGRNRDTDIVPSNPIRPFLVTHVDGTTDYINAAFIDDGLMRRDCSLIIFWDPECSSAKGYKSRCAYLATQSPLPNTMADLWRLAYDHRCRSIITLNNAVEEESTPVYWPHMMDDTERGDDPGHHGKLVFSPLEVTAINVETIEGVTVREFRIENMKKPKEDSCIVKLLQVRGWPTGQNLPCSPSVILGMLDLLEKWQQQTVNRPIIVECFNGANRSGVVIAAMYMIDKLKVDQEVDVFQTVKFVRLSRPQLISNLEQYIFLHELAAHYMARYDLYANFK